MKAMMRIYVLQFAHARGAITLGNIFTARSRVSKILDAVKWSNACASVFYVNLIILAPYTLE